MDSDAADVRDINRERDQQRRELRGLHIRDLFRLIDEAREERDRIARYVDLLHETIAEKMEHKTEIVPGIGTIRVGRTRNLKWDDDALFSRAKRHAEETRAFWPGTGEIEDAVSAYERVLKSWMKPDYWRVTPLKDAGLDIDEYAVTTWGPLRVQRLSRADAIPSPTTVPMGDEPEGRPGVRERDSEGRSSPREGGAEDA